MVLSEVIIAQNEIFFCQTIKLKGEFTIITRRKWFYSPSNTAVFQWLQLGVRTCHTLANQSRELQQCCGIIEQNAQL